MKKFTFAIWWGQINVSQNLVVIAESEAAAREAYFADPSTHGTSLFCLGSEPV